MHTVRSPAGEPPATMPAAALSGWIGIFATAMDLLLRLHDRFRQRCHLRELDIRLLNDVGLTPEDVRCATSGRFWRR